MAKYALVKNTRFLSLIEVHEKNWLYRLFGPSPFTEVTFGFDEGSALESLGRYVSAKRIVVKEVEL